MATIAWSHPACGAVPLLRRPRVGAATGPLHTSGPGVRSEAYPTHEDFDPAPPAPRTGSTRRSSDPGTEPARSPIAAHRSPTRSPDAAAVPDGIPPWPRAPAARPGGDPSWASTAAPPARPIRADSRGNETRDRTTRGGSAPPAGAGP